MITRRLAVQLLPLLPLFLGFTVQQRLGVACPPLSDRDMRRRLETENVLLEGKRVDKLGSADVKGSSKLLVAHVGGDVVR